MPQTSNIIQVKPTLIPTFTGQNFAPLEPLQKISNLGGAAKINNKITDALKERFQHYNKYESAAWNELYRAGQLVADFISGKQVVVANPFGSGGLVVRPQRQDESTKRALNVMQFYQTNILKTWMGSYPDVLVEAGRMTDSAMMAARGAAAVVDYYEKKFYDEWFEAEQAGYASSFGTYVVRYRWDMGVQGLMKLREIVENKTIKFGGFGYCGDCGHYGDANEFHPSDEAESVDNPQEEAQEGQQGPQNPQCPKCGSLAAITEPGASADVSNVVGTEQQNMGNLVCEQIPLTGLRWDLYKRMEESRFLLYKQRVTEGQLKALVGQVKFPGGEGESDVGLDIQKVLAYSGQAVSGRSSTAAKKTDSSKTVTLEEMWLSPEDLTDIELTGGEMTVCGQSTPKGNLSELCPDGLVAIGVNGMSVILGLYQESHRNTFVAGVYHPKVMSGAGRGSVDNVEVQKRINTLDSTQLSYMQTTATPAVLYRSEVIAEEEVGYLGDPMQNIPVKDLPSGMKLSDAVLSLPPGTVGPQMVNYIQEFLKNQMQTASHVVDFGGGLPGVNNKTATGAQIASALAQSLFSPMLKIKAYTRRRGAEIIIDLFRRHMPAKMPFPLAGQRNGSDGVYLSGADIPVDLTFRVVPDSELPKSTFSKREDLESMGLAFQGLGNYIQMKKQFPQEVAEIEKMYNVKTDSEDFDAITTLCRKRIQQMEAYEKMGATDPQQLLSAIQPAVSELEPLQQQKSDWFRGFLDTDDGQTASPLMRSAIESLAALHAQNDGQIQTAMATIAGQVQTAMAAPAAIGQAQLQQATAEHGAGLQAQAADQQHGHAIAQQAHAASVQPQDPGAPAEAPEPPPETKVAESAAYKDLPPEAQFEMLTKQMGLTGVKLSDVVKVHDATIEAAKMQNSTKLAAMKPKPATPAAKTGAKK